MENSDSNFIKRRYNKRTTLSTRKTIPTVAVVLDDLYFVHTN